MSEISLRFLFAELIYMRKFLKLLFNCLVYFATENGFTTHAYCFNVFFLCSFSTLCSSTDFH